MNATCPLVASERSFRRVVVFKSNRRVIFIAFDMDKNKDIWIGVIALAVISGVGVMWVVESSQATTAASSQFISQAVASTTAASSTDSQIQLPQTIDRSSQDVVTIIRHLSNDSEFSSLIATSGVASLLKGPGPYTVFVPTDGAFSQLPRGTISSLEPADLKRFVEYHFVANKAIDPASNFEGTARAISGDTLNFTLGPDNIPLVNSGVLITEYKGSNGVIFLIDNVLVPPTGNH